MNSNLSFLFALLALVTIASLALLTRSCSAPAFPPGFSPQITLGQALETSRESGKPVLVFFTADWCGPCQQLKRGALSSSRITRWIEANAETAYIDATRAGSGDTELAALLSRYQVRSFPTLIMLEPGRALEQKGRIEGNVRRRELQAWLESMK